MIIFEGEYLNGRRWDGKSKENKGYKTIEVEYINGIGKGKEYFGNEMIFEGEYINDKRNGKGKQYWISKLKYEGEFKDDKRNGKGKEYDYNGNIIFEGEYLNGKRLIRK